MVKRLFIILLNTIVFFNISLAQPQAKKADIEKRLNNFFLTYKPQSNDVHIVSRMVSYKINDNLKSIIIYANDDFASQEFTEKNVNSIYKKISKSLFKPYNKYNISIITNGLSIDKLINNNNTDDDNQSRLWGDIEYKDAPWTENTSRPNTITHGLQNIHISLWASHGRYFNQNKNTWNWQRPNLFCTTEDLFTQTIVIPYLIPMLENAGAIIFTPRERDWQKEELIVDNDNTANKSPNYSESFYNNQWVNTPQKGFAFHSGYYQDGENPFEKGTARMNLTTSKKNKISYISYQPEIKKEGRYAVYVSYQTVDGSIDDAHYIVYHKGEQTNFLVNQQMGGGTWVYLGTFDFDKGCNINNRVLLTNLSSNKGLVTADAVRFGGGMGNIERGGSVSGYPRCLEGARYYSQWAGAPYKIYSSKNGDDDYGDDINVRSYMTNWLGGGSIFMPSLEGEKVPIELSLAIHSDAGYSKDSKSIIGSLSICTTNFNDGRLNSGVSREISKEFATSLLENVDKDIKIKYGVWNKREMKNSNYSETRNPEVPSAILETMSHQNFPDMRYGQDPNFKFTLARSIYKTILKFISSQHGHSYIVEPLQPNNFRVEFSSRNKVTLKWNPTFETQEQTSKATSYNVYMATDNCGFNNGTNVKSTSYSVELKPNVHYRFRVTAVNRGGESFPTEVLSAVYQPNSTKTIIIVNGFHRLASPAIIENDTEQGFDINSDPGLSYGPTAGWNGYQECFDKSKIGIEGPGGLGYCNDKLSGKFIAGNDMNYVIAHADAIMTAHQYNIVSCSSEAVERGMVNLNKYMLVDLILGNEKDDGYSICKYKTFDTELQKRLIDFTQNHGRLFVSGSYIGSDMKSNSEQDFLSNVLKLRYDNMNICDSDSIIRGMGTSFEIYRTINEDHYAATSPESLIPVSTAFSALNYGNGTNAAVAYKGSDYKCFTMGFPFECIKDEKKKASIMRGILSFLEN
jgi:hypothetical protein